MGYFSDLGTRAQGNRIEGRTLAKIRKGKMSDPMDFITGGTEFDKELARFFKSLPPIYQAKAIQNIYRKSLKISQTAIQGNIHSKSGRLRNSVKIRVLRGHVGGDPAAMVHMSAKRDRMYKSRSGEQKKRVGGSWYAYLVEYGTADRTYKKGSRIIPFGGTTGFSYASGSGSIKGTHYFRRGVDSTKAMVSAEVERNFKRYGQKELDRQIVNWNRKATRMIIKM